MLGKNASGMGGRWFENELETIDEKF